MSEDEPRTDNSDGGASLKRGSATAESSPVQASADIPVRLADAGLMRDVEAARINGRAGAERTRVSPPSVGAEQSRVSSPSAGDGPGLAKILPFRRDWFGPVDDLVPVLPEPAGGTVISAASFWDEDAGAVHQVVEALDPRWVGEGDHEPLTPLVFDEPNRDPYPDSDRGWRADPDQDRGVARGRPERVRRVHPVAILVGGLSLVIVCAAVALLLLEGGLRHPFTPRPAVNKPAVALTVRPRSATASVPAQTLRVILASRSLSQAERRHARKVAAERAARRKAAHRPTTTTTAVTSSPSAPVSHPAPSTRPSAISAPSAPTSDAESAPAGGCAQSPDSGCLP